MELPSHKARQEQPNSPAVYVRHRPETTLLYQIVQEYWPEFRAELASHGKYLPAYVTKEFDELLKCGRLEFGFLRVRCEACHDEKLLAFSCKKRGFCPSCGARRMADSAALLVDDVLPHQPMRQWVLSVPFPLRFLRVKAPTKGELTRLTHTIAQRVGRYLKRQGLLERDTGNIYLTQEAVDASDEDPSNQLLGSSITYRIAVGPQQGRKVFTLQTLPDCQSDNPFSSSVGEVAGFSLHAGVATKANERAKLERLCRYITRPAVSTKRLSMTRNGRVRYELKTPWRNGTTHVIFEPLDFISRLVSLISKPRVTLSRFHGVFAPNSHYRARVTPTKRGRGKKAKTANDKQDQTPAERRAAVTWAQRLKRLFKIDIETCGECGGEVRIIATIEDPVVIRKILAHLDDRASPAGLSLLPECRAPPATGLFD